jgi:hypothetical protein
VRTPNAKSRQKNPQTQAMIAHMLANPAQTNLEVSQRFAVTVNCVKGVRDYAKLPKAPHVYMHTKTARKATPGIENQIDYTPTIREITINKTPPQGCLRVVQDLNAPIMCASIVPKVGSQHCEPCAKNFHESATRDLSFTNLRSASDYR